MRKESVRLLLIEENGTSFSALSEILLREKEFTVGLERLGVALALGKVRSRQYDICLLNCSDASIKLLNDFLAQHCTPSIIIMTNLGETLSTETDDAQEQEEEPQPHLLESVVRKTVAYMKECEQTQRNDIGFWTKFLEDSTAIAFLDSEGRFLVENRAFQKLFGYSHREIACLILNDLVHPEEVQEQDRLFQQLLNGAETQYRLEGRFLLKSGAYAQVRQTAMKLVDRENSKQFVLLALEDVVTQEPALEQEREAGVTGNVSSQLFYAHESERKLVAQELHDSLGASLAAIKYTLEKNLMQLEKKRGRAEVSLAEVIPLVQSAMEEARRISTNLWPSVLDDLGIIATINSFCSEFQKTYSSIKVEKHLDALEQEIPLSLKVVVYRIIQEALNNVAKHSGAKRVRLSLLKTKEFLELLVQDDGRGFDVKDEARSGIGKMGLMSMKNRAEASGGMFLLESGSGEGTRVRTVWPRQ
ncbi:MAG: PAS domain S-box protein [Candidatus Abyssobacteria bacterium SURF_5]|uniref:histidine kinase n=1 Tax=Abyssobacteria bacterium (strain SURF_5) TaxID=2093360 RepID=A0A3A4P240_ABYX5|nr:MAG: PAS domain S-box protein [Candidatus Abyssubacteria bacterium SURF_5]